MTNDEINRYIHEQVMGKCWHREYRPHKEHPHTLMTCAYCEHSMGSRQAHEGAGVPDYCSDESPRSLLNEVVTAVALPNSYAHFEDTLFEVIQRDHLPQEWRQYNNSYLTYMFLNATARQLAQACVEAHKGA